MGKKKKCPKCGANCLEVEILGFQGPRLIDAKGVIGYATHETALRYRVERVFFIHRCDTSVKRIHKLNDQT